MSTSKLVIVGQGYVGLPLSMRGVSAGYNVVGFDIDERRIGRLRDGQSYVDDVSNGELISAKQSGRYTADSSPDCLEGFEIAVVTVPTPLVDGAPDLTYVEEAARTLSGYISRGCCVILESTTYPGTTEELFVPLLDQNPLGLIAGTDYDVGYSPERIDPGNAVWTISTTPKVVSGVSAASLDRLATFYESVGVGSVVRVAGTKEAELAKLLENTFRHVNIALVNELSMFCHSLGIDFWQVLDAAESKPFGFMRFNPGPGVGGHCLPIDPSYLSWQIRRNLGRSFQFVEVANSVNQGMPDYVVGRITDKLNGYAKSVRGSRIVVIGLTYKKNSSDARESPALEVVTRLVRRGADLKVVDEHVELGQLRDAPPMASLSEELMDQADLIVVLTDHDSIDWEAVSRHSTKVLDTRHRMVGSSCEML